MKCKAAILFAATNCGFGLCQSPEARRSQTRSIFSNMDPFAIVEPRELSLKPKPAICGREQYRHPFSLIEVMIVIVLVGIIAGVSAFSLWPFYQSYRFRLEAETLYELFQELQLEAMTLQSDIQVRFTKDNNDKWIARSLSDEPVLKSQIIDLSHVEQLNVSNEFTITLYSNGLVNPRSILKLSSKSDHRWLDFSGGHLIKFCEVEPQPIAYERFPDLEEIKRSLAEKEEK